MLDEILTKMYFYWTCTLKKIPGIVIIILQVIRQFLVSSTGKASKLLKNYMRSQQV